MAIAVANRPQFCGLAGKLGAAEAQIHTFSKRTGGNLTHPVLLSRAACLTVRASARGHARADLTGDAAYAYFH
jgi:hypothetical protein